jgi:hypothetical protein
MLLAMGDQRPPEMIKGGRISTDNAPLFIPLLLIQTLNHQI